MYITQQEEVAIIKLLAIARTHIPDETEWQRLVETGQIVKFGDISKQVSDMIERIEKKRMEYNSKQRSVMHERRKDPKERAKHNAWYKLAKQKQKQKENK